MLQTLQALSEAFMLRLTLVCRILRAKKRKNGRYFTLKMSLNFAWFGKYGFKGKKSVYISIYVCYFFALN